MKAIAEWMWIAAGVIAGLIVFSIAQNQIYQLNIATIEQRSLEQFYEVKNIINNLCWSFAGNTREYTLNLGESIEGIYASKDKYTEYKKDELVDNIREGNTSEGNFLCIKIKDKRLKCEEIECNTSMIFVGSLPTELSLSALVNRLLGKGNIFSYELTIVRGLDKVFIYEKGLAPFSFTNCVIDKSKGKLTCDTTCKSSQIMVLSNSDLIYGKPNLANDKAELVDKRISNLKCPANTVLICDKPAGIGVQTNLPC